MSFIKVKDPRKREELIKDFIETRKRIKDNFVARKVGEAEYQTGLTKLFKPVTETQKATAKEITEAQKEATEKITKELLPIKTGIEGLPGALSFPTYPTLEMTEGEPIPAVEMYKKEKNLGLKALKALENIKSEDKTTFGMYFKDGDFNIGDKKVDIEGDDIIIDGIKYTGSDGLWELIMKDEPQEGIYSEKDFLEYGKILKKTNAIYQNNDPNQNYPKSSKSSKWKQLIKPIWEDIKKSKKPPEEGKGKGKGRRKRQEDPQPSTSGTGLKILPSDPNALIDRFDLLFSSQKAGHTGVRNEIVSILDELKRQGVISVQDYKKLNHLIKK